MRHLQQHIHRIIENYEGKLPLHHFLKSYYKKYPILGSRDRKMLSDMAFSWYRCSKGFDENLSFDRKLEACLFLSETNAHQVLQLLRPEWQGKHDYFLQQKLQVLEKDKMKFNIQKLLSTSLSFSTGMDKEQWLRSLLQQPDLFIRYRKNSKQLIRILQDKNIQFRQVGENCFAFPNATKLQELLPEKDYVVQDASSQMTAVYLSPKPEEYWWDCCSGAGGKSLLLKDLQPEIHLTVTDKRKSILHNLQERFQLYHKNVPEIVEADMADENALKRKLEHRQFDNIICDVPCSGSGTWARTPEQAYFFEEKNIKEFSELQEKIAVHATRYLKKDGRLIYITCSVFQKENENAVASIEANSTLKCSEVKLINGIENKADSMFVAMLKN